MTDVTYTLSRPLVSVDQTFTVLTVREPTGKDLKKAGDPASTMAFTQRLAEICAGLIPGALDDAPAMDVLGLSKIVSGFLETPPAAS